MLAVLSPDNDARKSAEARLSELSRDPALVSGLLQLMRSSPDAAKRQLAAVLLRKRLGGLWTQLTAEAKEGLKSTLLESIAQETR